MIERLKNNLFHYPPIFQWDKKSSSEDIIVFDTNVLLDMYYIKQEDLEYWKHYLDSIKEYTWTPYNIYLEFKKNRQIKINQIKGRIDELLTFKNIVGKQCDNFFKPYEDFPFEYGRVIGKLTKDRIKGIDQYILYYENILKEIKKSTGKLTYEKADNYLKLIEEKIFFNLGEKYTEESLKKICEEGNNRFKNKIPPGYYDNGKNNSNKYGDYIIWRQMIEKSKKENKNIIFVTNEKKPDWKKDGVCREELIEEFNSLTGNQFILLDLDQLINYTTKSSKNVEECLYNIKQSLNKNIKTYSIWGEKFMYHEKIEQLLEGRRGEYVYFKGTDDIAFSQLTLLRRILEYTVSRIVCGPIYMPRYAMFMDVWFREEELIEPFCNLYYKANNCLSLGMNRKERSYCIVGERDNKECRTGYIHEMFNLILYRANKEGYLSDQEIDTACYKLERLYKDDEWNSL